MHSPYPPREFELRMSCVLILVFAAVTSGCLLLSSAHRIGYQGDNTHPESCVVQNALWSLSDHHLYHSIDSSPFTPAPYGPLFYWQLSKLALIVGGDFQSTLEAGRIVVFGCFIFLPLLCLMILKRLGIDTVSGLLAVTLLASNIDFQLWNVSNRPDIPALLFELAALLLLTYEAGLSTAASSGLCIGLAMLMKTTSPLAGAIAIASYFILDKKWKLLAMFVAAAAVPVIGTYSILEIKGDPALHHLMLLRHLPSDGIGAIQLLSTAVGSPAKRVLLALGLVSFFPVILSGGKRRIFGFYFVASWLLGLAELMQVGGNVNYLFSASVATALLAGVSLSDLRSRWADIHASVKLILLMVLVVEVGAEAWTALKLTRNVSSPTVSQLVNQFKGKRILSDVSYIAAQGKDPMLLDTFLLHNLEDRGAWSPYPIVSRLDEKYWDVVIERLGPDGRMAVWRHTALLSPSIQRAIERNYESAGVCDGIRVLLPKSNSAKPKSEFMSMPQCDFRVAPSSAAMQ